MKPLTRIVLPTRASIYVLAALGLVASVALSLGAPLATVAPLGVGLLLALLALAGLDLWRSLRLWREGGLRVERRLPAAFAIGASTELKLALVNPGKLSWRLQVFDELDPVFDFEGLPRTLEGQTLPLARPFIVMATQNPVDTEGTYPLPEAQLDRFLLKVVLPVPEQIGRAHV